MIVYQSTKENFIKDVRSNNIDDVILDCYYFKTGRKVSHSEQTSWRRSMHYMKDVLADKEIPQDSGVTIEYHIPQTCKRIDFILTGQNQQKADHAILIELKQWSESGVSLSGKDGIVSTTFYGDVSHPSYQAWSYAALLRGFNETVYSENIQLKPCAYLHNYIEDDVIKNDFYSDYIRKAPVFLQGDEEKEKLRKFIKQFVKYGDNTKVMYRIDGGKIKPSKSLADSLANMLKGNQEFVMIDDQKIVYETALALAKKSSEENKNVLIVEGGPGTGKSVVAVNLLVALTELGLVGQYVTKNAAPRTVYESMLTGQMRRTEITNMFSGSGSFIEADQNIFDYLVVDEAHRLNEKSGLFRNLGENQIKEIIEASKFSVFFIDEDQRVTWQDIGQKEEIEKWAVKSGAKVHVLELVSQFRCNGSNGYIAWLDDILQIRETANKTLDQAEYEFKIVSSPNELKDIIFEKNKEKNKARLVAGYCWDWISKKNGVLKDITIPEHDFSMRWNLASDGSLWILALEAINEIGCIHTCQGLELDYVGVIIGPDFIIRDEKVKTDPSKRAKTDKSLSGYKKDLKENPFVARKKADEIIKNTYRTLMTRGMKGCYVYFTDKETEQYFRDRIETERQFPPEIAKPVAQRPFKLIEPTEKEHYKKCIPLYDLKAAAGGFSDFKEVDSEEWVIPNVNRSLSKGMFVAQVVGKSMEPLIPDGSYGLFKFYTGGSRQGRIVLAQHQSIEDPDMGGRFTVKKYESKKVYNSDGSWRHTDIILKPLNPDYKPIILTVSDESEIQIIAELLEVLG